MSKALQIWKLTILPNLMILTAAKMPRIIFAFLGRKWSKLIWALGLKAERKKNIILDVILIDENRSKDFA